MEKKEQPVVSPENSDKNQELQELLRNDVQKNMEVEEVVGDVIEDEYETQHEELSKLLSQKWEPLEEGKIVKGKVIAKTDDEIIVSVGFKSESAIPANEFENPDEIKIGDEVEVFVESLDTAKGGLKLSRKTARAIKTWEFLNKALEEELEVEGKITRRTKGGFVVDFGGIEAFLPGSQVDVKPIRDYDVFVGKTMRFKVVKINPTQHNVVVSHKVIIEKEQAEKRKKIIDILEPGIVLEGTVKNIVKFGVFIDLGGVDGLLKVQDISWRRNIDPKEMFEIDQKVKVVVLEVDEDKTKVVLGMKQLEPHPWENLPEDIKVGAKVKGKVVHTAEYGIIVEVLPGVEGIIRLNEISWSMRPVNPKEKFKIGDEVEAVVIDLDKKEQKLVLSIKRLKEDPWEKAAEKYKVGTVHKGIVRNITEYGAFIELEEGIDGFLHATELSWVKITDPKKELKENQELEVKVIDLNPEERRIRLSHKQLTPDPWDELAKKFPEGSKHKGKIVALQPRGAIVELEGGVQGFCPNGLLVTPKGEPALKEGDEAEFVIKKFDKQHRRITLSHVDTWKKKSEAVSVASEKDKEAYKRKKAASAKLGDLSEFSKLKEMIEQEKEQEKQTQEETKTEEPSSQEKQETQEENKSESKEENKDSE